MGTGLGRRGFLAALAGLAGAATLDPERLLWIPGKRLISIPAAAPPGEWIRLAVDYPVYARTPVEAQGTLHSALNQLRTQVMDACGPRHWPPRFAPLPEPKCGVDFCRLGLLTDGVDWNWHVPADPRLFTGPPELHGRLVRTYDVCGDRHLVRAEVMVWGERRPRV